MDINKFDILYFYKKSITNLEIKYSIRSLEAYLSDYINKIYIFGDFPDYLNNEKVAHINERRMIPTYVEFKCRLYVNKNLNLTPYYLWMCDDWFVINNITLADLKPQYLQELEGIIPNKTTPWRGMLWRTYDLLKGLGVSPVYNYETHTPCLINQYEFDRAVNPFVSVIQACGHRYDGICSQTAYLNLTNEVIELKKMEDSIPILNVTKLNDIRSKCHGKKFLFTSDRSFDSSMITYLDEMYPAKSTFEL